MNRRGWWVALALALWVAGGQAAGPKNVIILIGDGCGYNQFALGRLWRPAQAEPWERWPVRLAMATGSTNTAAKGYAYDPAKAWATADWVKGTPTDSAAAATALACGVKTYNGAIGVGPDKQPVTNLMERAEALGKATGVVTTVPLSHATPAGFVAHADSRKSYAEIGREMLTRAGLEVIMGAGHPGYDHNNKVRQPKDETAYQYVGGQAIWDTLKAGRLAAGKNAGAPWKLILARSEFQALATGPTPERVCGVARVPESTQCSRDGGSKEALPFATPLNPDVPTLAEMTRAALNVLDNDPDGFCLMIEGGAIDWAGHNNWLGRMVEEVLDFQAAIVAVDTWVGATGRWADTLVIVTADHETGYLTGPSFFDAAGQFNPAAAPWPLVGVGPRRLPRALFHSGAHTNSLVPLFAKGAGSEALARVIAGTDPHRGRYIDNTRVAQSIFELWR